MSLLRLAHTLILYVGLLAALLMTSGCTYVYQPLSGLHDPTVVDIQAPNLVGVHLTIRCISGVDLSPQEAGVLCQRLRTLFENQGAVVQTTTAANMVMDELSGTQPTDPDAPPLTELQLEIRSRTVQESNDPVLWALNIATYTLVPAVTTSTFAQDITIRDGTGFLLATDTLQGRIVRRFGAGAWTMNKLLNLTVRSDEEKITSESAGQDLSSDLYHQLSQLVFNARTRSALLQEASSERSWN